MVSFKPLLLSLPLTTATLLASFSGTEPISSLGSCQLEGQYHYDTIKCDQTTGLGNSSIYIKPNQKDPNGTPCLHYHHDAHFRRAEIKVKGTYAANSHYYAGFTFLLNQAQPSLTLFQWKKANGTVKPVQNIPFYVHFVNGSAIGIGYTVPDQAGQIQAEVPIDLKTKHSIALAWDTYTPGAKRADAGGLTMYLDGKKVFEKTGLTLWTGPTYPKFGIYRGESDGPYDVEPKEDVFDYYLHAAAVSDKSLDEVAAAGGLS